ncbi:MAG: response regulator [Thermoflexales bacterium]|nr:response regulator [Thermoflexales bacterium]
MATDTKSIILIVDDDDDARELVAMLLQREEYHLVLAGDGQEALDKAEQLTPDLILLDVMMPIMSGFEACRRLRANPLLEHVPIILITALGDRPSRLEGLEAGADDFITKPFDKSELRARVHTVTRLNRYRRLLAERAKFEWVVEHATDGYLMIDEQDRVTYANSQAQTYLDLSRESQASATSFYELAQKHYHCEPQAAWTGWLNGMTPVHELGPLYLVRPETPMAKALWLQVNVLNVPGEEKARVIRLHDITVGTVLQDELNRFHSMIAHKLRTPLVPIYSGLQFLIAQTASLSKEAIATFLQQAFKGVERLREEIEDIVQYLHAPSLARQPGEAFQLARLPALVTHISGELALSASVSSEGQLDQGCLPLSQHNVELILWEILENALKFHPMQAPSVQVHIARPTPHQISIRIRDDGLTLPPEQLAHIWRPYYQVDKLSSGEVAGMGLGLSIVATQVWSIGGTCRAFNRDDGPGIVVEIVLPLKEDTASHDK